MYNNYPGTESYTKRGYFEKFVEERKIREQVGESRCSAKQIYNQLPGKATKIKGINPKRSDRSTVCGSYKDFHSHPGSPWSLRRKAVGQKVNEGKKDTRNNYLKGQTRKKTVRAAKLAAGLATTRLASFSYLLTFVPSKVNYSRLPIGITVFLSFHQATARKWKVSKPENA